jgi:5-methylcytosine-specific restriction endonuclease McrA
VSLLSAEAVGPLVGVDPATLRDWASRGAVPAIDTGGRGVKGDPRWLFDLDKVQTSLRGLVGASAVAEALGVSAAAVHRLAQSGIIPTAIQGVELFDRDHVVAIVRRRMERKLCRRCDRDLPLSAFSADTRRGSVMGQAGWCRECSNRANRERRQRIADADGRRLRAPGEWQREQAAARAAREAERKAEVARRAAERAARKAERDVERKRRGKTLTVEESRRSVARQRERYNTDPEYQARIKAKKIRRKRAVAGTTVEPVNREAVAARDGWRCCICGGKVTRRDWSLDHIVPLSQGGTHTYANVALAHRGCNSARGVGRLPSQAPLFAKVA